MKKYGLWILFLLSMPWIAQAQIEIYLSAPRRNFLLYEQIILEASIQNISGKNVPLENTSSPWLSFIVSKANGEKIQADYDFSPQSRVLRLGEQFTLPVNITPFYKIRETGQYSIQAVVQLDEKNSIVTSPLVINIGMGNPLWSQTLKIANNDRIYQLIHFAERDQNKIYLRIEEPQNNIAYGSVLLGEFNSSLKIPDPLFDSQNNLHILHPKNAQTYIYTISDPIGKILSQKECDLSYQLRQSDGGKVSLEK